VLDARRLRSVTFAHWQLLCAVDHFAFLATDEERLRDVVALELFNAGLLRSMSVAGRVAGLEKSDATVRIRSD